MPNAARSAAHFHCLREVHSQRVTDVGADLEEDRLAVGYLGGKTQSEKSQVERARY